jgi:hypothetical protein
VIFSRRALLVAALGGCLSGVRAAEPMPAASPVLSTAPAAIAFAWRTEAQTAFAPGETIRYVIKYGILPSGVATLEIRSTDTVRGRPVYYLHSEARTNKTIDAFFKVRDKNESWMDVQSLASLRFRQSMREGGYMREVETDYDHAARSFTYRKRRKGKETVVEGPIPPFVQDVLSSLYFIRTRPLVVGQTYTLDANSGAVNWPLRVHVLRKEKVRVPAGVFQCLRLDPILAGEGIFQAKGKLLVWVTDDERRVPVLLRSKVAVGAFDAEMREYIPGGSPAAAVLPAPPPKKPRRVVDPFAGDDF